MIMKSKLFIGLVLISCVSYYVECRAVRQAATCSFQTDDYSLSWEYDELSSDVVFKLSASSRNPSFWSGVYFGDEEKPSDVIGVFVRSGQIGLVDGHVNSENDIESDETTNVQSLTFDLQDHTLTAEFARPLTSIDETDADLSNCVTFYFPINAPAIDIGGPVEVPKNLIKKRVCDLAVSCSSSHSLVVKRADNSSTTCKYESNDKQRSVSWQKMGENVLFSIEQPAKKGKWWTAIGVGESMQDLDLIITFAENGKVQHTGGYKSIGYSSPEVDETLTSAHKLDSFNVADDKSFFNIVVPSTFLSSRMENDCVTVQMGILAGTYAKKRNDFIIQKHRDSPIAVTICNIDQCSLVENTSEPLPSSSTPTSTAASSIVPNNEIEDVIIEKNDHQVQNQETVQEPEQELLSAENPKRDDDKSLEGSGQQAGIFETVSHELQEIQGSGEDTDKSKSSSDEVLPNFLETNMTNTSQANDLIEQSFSTTAEKVQSNTSGLGPENSSILSSQQPNLQDILLTSTPADSMNVVVIVSSTSQIPEELIENVTALNQGDAEKEDASNTTTLLPSSSSAIAQDNEPMMNQASSSIFDLSVANLTDDGSSTDSSQDNSTSSVTSNGVVPSTNASPTFTSVSSGSDLTTAIVMLNSPTVQKNIEGSGSGEEPLVESTKKEVLSSTTPTTAMNESTEAAPQTVSVSNEVVMLNTILPTQTCSQEDLKVCQSYFDDYLIKVADWSRRHDFSASSQQWKACKLLSEVKNVPTLCCNRYQQECANVTPPPQ
ncbi:unnamed protein product [Auanema sp. JU1783]|nr:unnamed protein product [Auanema sp. JU1783]